MNQNIVVSADQLKTIITMAKENFKSSEKFKSFDFLSFIMMLRG